MSLNACGSTVSASWPTPMFSLAVRFGCARGARARAEAVSASRPDRLAADSPKTAARPRKLLRLIVFSRYSSTRSASVSRCALVKGSPTLSFTTSMAGLRLFTSHSLWSTLRTGWGAGYGSPSSSPPLSLARDRSRVDVHAAGHDAAVRDLVDLGEVDVERPAVGAVAGAPQLGDRVGRVGHERHDRHLLVGVALEEPVEDVLDRVLADDAGAVERVPEPRLRPVQRSQALERLRVVGVDQLLHDLPRRPGHRAPAAPARSA